MTSLAQHTHPYPGLIVRKVQVFFFFSGHAPIAAFEYASGREARIVGKPSTEYFSLALEGLDLKPEKVAMVGDDIGVDIEGAQKVGHKTVIVQTGKFRRELFQRSRITPDAVLKSIAELPDWLK